MLLIDEGVSGEIKLFNGNGTVNSEYGTVLMGVQEIEAVTTRSAVENNCTQPKLFGEGRTVPPKNEESFGFSIFDFLYLPCSMYDEVRSSSRYALPELTWINTTVLELDLSQSHSTKQLPPIYKYADISYRSSIRRCQKIQRS